MNTMTKAALGLITIVVGVFVLTGGVRFLADHLGTVQIILGWLGWTR